MKPYLPILIPITVFLFLKISNLGIRLSDTNIYFYTAHQLLQGKMLYKDIFFTNFPLLPYASMIYYFLVNKSLLWYYFTPAVEASIISFFIYHIAFHYSKDRLISLTSTLLYLFSFIILATTDHQTGVFLASLFSIISYYFLFEKKRFVVSGIFIALTLLTKAYFLPIFLALLVTYLIKNPKKTVPFLLGAAVTAVIILLPSLLFAQSEFIRDVFIYSLTRSQGIDKGNIVWFFIKHELPLFMLLLLNIVFIRKQLFFGLLSIFSIIFVLLYQDIYYLYLNFAVPFLALSFAFTYTRIQKELHLQRMVIPSLIFLIIIINLSIYLASFRNMQKVPQIQEIVTQIKQENPTVLYGVNSLTPALAYLAGIPLLNNIVDTNENIFRKGFLKKDVLTREAIKQHGMIVTQGVSYPSFNIRQDIVGGMFNAEEMQKSCTLRESYPVKTEGLENRVNLFSC